MVALTEWRNGLLSEWLLVVPNDLTWGEARAQAEAKLEETRLSERGRGAQLTLEFGLRPVTVEQLTEFVQHLKTAFGLLTVAIVGSDRQTQDAARALTLNAYLMPPGGHLERAEDAQNVGSNALYLPSTVRSGQRIVHGGHVIVNGDVNAGAEIMAEGDILIFGTLRGLAHAGSGGSETARIVAGSMRPQQIRIAGKIARAPEDNGPGQTRTPEVARIENGEIQVFPV